MTTKYTAGPWRYEAGRDGRPPYVIRGTEGGFVVVGMTADRQEADARLIAAAPELLESLEACCDALDWVIEQGGGPTCEHEAGVCFCKESNALNAARAAIAKAKGEQQ
ncbi:hypothetical protein P3W70_07135 [Achromobacter denitrificans]|uniref:hypothetical protein n=1 Tax=Achromobacter denitrificans TaxID=32002 RepID=UPI0023E87EAE|nr:hypothetical protein [Achromobacter denitrificans]MDF3858113.1 hypothetical protein [Achromobacter denitrificans]